MANKKKFFPYVEDVYVRVFSAVGCEYYGTEGTTVLCHCDVSYACVRLQTGTKKKR